MHIINNRTSPVFLLFTALIWGSGFIVTHIALYTGISPYFFTAARLTIATVLFYLLFHRRLRRLSPLIWPGLVLGFFLSMAFIFQTVGLQYTTPSKNAFITATNVVFTPIIVSIASRRVIGLKLFTSIVLVVTGIGLLTLEELSRFNLGDLLTLLCAVFFALHIYFIGHYVRDKGYDLYKIVFLQFLFSSIFAAVCAVSLGDIELPTINGVFLLLYQAVLSTMLGFFLQNSAQRHLSQTKAALLLSSEAAFGTILSVTILNEVVTFTMIVGFAFLSSGIVLSQIVPKGEVP